MQCGGGAVQCGGGNSAVRRGSSGEKSGDLRLHIGQVSLLFFNKSKQAFSITQISSYSFLVKALQDEVEFLMISPYIQHTER